MQSFKLSGVGVDGILTRILRPWSGCRVPRPRFFKPHRARLCGTRPYTFSKTPSRAGISLTKPKCASLGAVNYSLLTALYNACRGDSGLKEYESRTSTGKGKRDASVDEAVSLVKAHMRIFFPSRETVVQSKGGKDVGFFLSGSDTTETSLTVFWPR